MSAKRVSSVETEKFQLLVSELLKSKPDLERVRLLSEEAGVSYTSDPIQLMGTILQKMNGLSMAPRKNRKSELLEGGSSL